MTTIGRRGRTVLITAGAVLLIAAAIGVFLLLAPGGPPSVTFASVAGTQSTGPAQYCDIKVTHCDNHPEAVVTMAVPAGQPLRVSVPKQVSSAPWQVVFVYRPKGGAPIQGRSPVFAPDQHRDYTLTLPAASDQLITAQAQQYGGATPAPDANGNPSFPIRASWVMQVP